MDIRKLNDHLFVTGQLQPDHMPDIAARGFRALICNRPDHEEAGQPSFDAIAAAAREAGLQARHIPVRHGALGVAEIRAMDAALQSLPGPILAYCRTGRRSEALHGILAGG